MKLKTVGDFNLIIFTPEKKYEITPQEVEIEDEQKAMELLEKFSEQLKEVKEDVD